MPLVHYFAVIPQDSKQTIVEEDMESVMISDSIMQYIGDSFQWINTNWNGEEMKKGLSWYGYSIIEDAEINKLQNIIRKWRELFLLAPEEFFLTCEFLPDEGVYDKINIKKEVLIKQFDSLLCICEEAIEGNAKILHDGI